MLVVDAPRDWLRTVIWTALIAYMIAGLIGLVVGLYFAARALAGDGQPRVVCTQPQTAGGPDWGISTVTCDAR